jgi:hypothetical protein
MKRYKVVIGVQPRLSKLFFVNNLNCVPMVIFETIGSGLSIRIIATILGINLSENHCGEKIYLNNPNWVPTALRNGSETPGSKPLNFGLNVLIAAGRVDNARSAVVCTQSVLCHLKNERFSAVARRKLSHSSTAVSAVHKSTFVGKYFVFLVMQTLQIVSNDALRS